MIPMQIHLEGYDANHGRWMDEYLPAVPRVGDKLWYDHLWEDMGAIVWIVEEVRWYPSETDRDGVIQIITVRDLPHSEIA